MRTGKAILWLVFLVGMSALDCTAKVYVRWTQSKLPTANVLGVNEIVIPWNEGATALLVEAKRQGYQAYLEVGAAQIADAMTAAGKVGIAGVILHGDATEHSALAEKAKELRTSHPKLKILVIDPNGKQPDMRGWLVFKKDGILQVSSPTSQPWLDANLAMIRHTRASEGARVPFYTFAWDESDPLVKEQGPKPVDYALAIAEAGAYHADLLLQVHEAQQKGLASGDKNALATWAQVKRYLHFYRQSGATEAEARVGVLTGDYEASYEALNLMARHNIPFRVLKSSEVKAADLAHFDVLIAFAELGKDLANAINEFAREGGVAVLVKLQGPFAWESAGAVATATSGPSTTYTVGKGRVIELKEAVIDPETFAQDVRRLMAKASVPVSLWNSLTTLVAAYPGEKAGAMNVELVNYDEESSEVQVQVKGAFRSAEYETPEGGCCRKIKVVRVDGFTQFVVPDLVVGGRVRLE